MTPLREEVGSFSKPISDPEVFIGLVGPIGTDLSIVSKAISDELSNLNYQSKIIKITDMFEEFNIDVARIDHPADKRYLSYIDFGNRLREKSEQQDIMTKLAIAQIRKSRAEIDKTDKRTAFIISQFKRPEEIDLMRRVYGRAFAQFSVYSERRIRESNLLKNIEKSDFRTRSQHEYSSQAARLISVDELQEDNIFGQRVRDTFPLADLIVQSDVKDSISIHIRRFLHAFFSNPFVSPNRNEYGAYLAQAASFRSADLSRQVGACILTEGGEVISLGCNEVPRAGGGVYWEGDGDDLRDCKYGKDTSQTYKREILYEIVSRLKESGWMSVEQNSNSVDELFSKATTATGPLYRSRILDLLEHGRVVHAEMVAITEAAKRGISVKGATLYTTTFPCHNCARHIVSSGISKVIYLEPYAKSLAEDLYPDSISIDGRIHRPGPKVVFQQFVGVAPERFRDIFRYQDTFYKHKRKREDGTVDEWFPQKSQPKVYRIIEEYLQIEKAIVDDLAEVNERLGGLFPSKNITAS